MLEDPAGQLAKGKVETTLQATKLRNRPLYPYSHN